MLALLRLDRLRGLSDGERTLAAVDRLLSLFPEQARLAEGAGLQPGRDFDSLLVAISNPADDATTLLAIRHRLSDSALQAALDHGARAASQAITWRSVGDRPVGTLHQRSFRPDAARPFDGDDRILVLSQPSLVIVAPAVYAAQLPSMNPPAPPTPSGGVDAASLPAGTTPHGREHDRMAPWDDLVARIEAEEATMPEDAVFAMTAWRPPRPLRGDRTGESGPQHVARDDCPAWATPAEVASAPTVITLVLGSAALLVKVDAEFATSACADAWEHELPNWRQALLVHPAVRLGGLSSLVERARTSRNGDTLEVSLEMTGEELRRLLNLLANLPRIRAAFVPLR